MVLSSLVNNTKVLKTIIYFIFILIPLGAYLFFKVNQKENYVSQTSISRIYLFISLIQLPIILLQRYGAYDILIGFNRSSQSIASFDFMFGSFFLKADHALGFFLIFNIINLIENNKNKNITKYGALVITYLSITILLTESNISKLILILLFLYISYVKFPKRIKILSIFFMMTISYIAFNSFKNIKAFDREIYFIKKEYNQKKSLGNFKRGIAKRPQVVITYLTSLPVKYLGEGPYSYFNVLTGKFTLTEHFSQIIWTYADLGIFGLILFLLILYNLVLNLGLDPSMNFLVFSIVLVYSFMTNIFSDLAITITMVSILNNKTN